MNVTWNRIAAASISILVCFSASAHTSPNPQPPNTSVPSNLPSQISSVPASDEEERRQLFGLARFGYCSVMRDPDASVAILLSADYAQPGVEPLRNLVRKNADCLRSGSFRFNQVIFAGDVAEAIYIKEGFSYTWFNKEWKEIKPTDGIACVIFRQPQALDDLTASFPKSAEERSALDKLAVAVSECMPDISRHDPIRRAALSASAFPMAWQLIRATR